MAGAILLRTASIADPGLADHHVAIPQSACIGEDWLHVAGGTSSCISCRHLQVSSTPTKTASCLQPHNAWHEQLTKPCCISHSHLRVVIEPALNQRCNDGADNRCKSQQQHSTIAPDMQVSTPRGRSCIAAGLAGQRANSMAFAG